MVQYGAMKTYHPFDNPGAYTTINGLRVHYRQAGSGNTALILMHGSFLDHTSWRHIIPPLAQHYTVVAFDRIAFGQTDRPMPPFATPMNPYSPEAQADLMIGLMDKLGLEQAVLVGNSTGGTIALLAALHHPTRVAAIISIGGMVYSGYPVSEMPDLVRKLLPKGFGPFMIQAIIGRAYNRMIRSFWHDPTNLPDEVLAHYRTLLHQTHWNTAVWQLISATHHLHLDEQLPTLTLPVLVISGEHDRTVPVAQSIRLAQELPNAGLALLPNCGHVPQEECPQALLQAIARFLPI
jgi:pimeloyl-ACP methyl ester carboxylesterase